MRWLLCPVYAVGLISIFFQMPKVKIRPVMAISNRFLEYFNAFGFYVLHDCYLGTSKTFR